MIYYEYMDKQERFFASESGKNKLWEEKRKEIEKLKDKLGKGVDEGVKGAITALTLLGIHTTASCEGHLDHGTFAPYIDVTVFNALATESQRNEIKDQEVIDFKIKEEVIRKNLQERQKLITLLDEFYSDRQSPFHKRLTIQARAWGRSRIESIGAELQQIIPQEVRRERLSEYQEEMNSFSDFLKQKYFDSL